MWNAKQYDIFTKQRQQPSKDLLSRIASRQPQQGERFRILDVGCGSGMSTLPLAEQWPDAEIIGVDYSEEMLQSAAKKSDRITWIRRDCSQSLEDLGKFDIVFSNAFLQWIPNQEEFFANIAKNVKDNGCLAMQIPAYDGMPADLAITRAVEKYKDYLIGELAAGCHNQNLVGYYEMVMKYFSEVEMWQTNYGHVMPDYDAIVEFFRGSALTPYLTVMDETTQMSFLQEVHHQLVQEYPLMKNGSIMFTFPRIFLLASYCSKVEK